MKQWINPEVTELEIKNTEQGGKNFPCIDQSWKDEKTGLSYVSYNS